MPEAGAGEEEGEETAPGEDQVSPSPPFAQVAPLAPSTFFMTSPFGTSCCPGVPRCAVASPSPAAQEETTAQRVGRESDGLGPPTLLVPQFPRL